ncbi:MAG: trehalose-phosphatase [Candidatus Limnocylindrales bacterium]
MADPLPAATGAKGYDRSIRTPDPTSPSHHLTPADATPWRAALGLLAAADLARRPCLVVSDFDGTISRIGLDPWGSRVQPQAQRALRRLAGMPGVEVVLLSGRTAVDLVGRVRVGGATYLGNHGLEAGFLPRGARAETLAVVADGTFEAFSAYAERLAEAVPAAIGEPWIIVEPKPPAVTFWFRSAPDIAAAGRQVQDAIDRLDPEGRFERFVGRRAIELRPPGAMAKREAFGALLEERRPGLVVLLGDDRSDAEAFAVLRSARAAGRLAGLALAVHTHPEVSPAVAAEADAMLGSPSETARFLAGLARALTVGT